jgi:hypothetical protein
MIAHNPHHRPAPSSFALACRMAETMSASANGRRVRPCFAWDGQTYYKCRDCNRWRPKSNFSGVFNPKSACGIQSYCKPCHSRRTYAAQLRREDAAGITSRKSRNRKALESERVDKLTPPRVTPIAPLPKVVNPTEVVAFPPTRHRTRAVRARPQDQPAADLGALGRDHRQGAAGAQAQRRTAKASSGARCADGGGTLKPESRCRRPWTDTDRLVVREHFRKVPASQIARQLGRTPSGVFQCARNMGLSIPQRFKAPDMVAFIRARNAEGWSDAEIAAARGVDRHAVGHVRKSLGLPCNGKTSDRYRARVRAKTAEQLKAAGVPTLAALRCKVYRERSRAAGWPEDLRPRAVQMLSVLWERGPQTRRQLAEAIGMPWLGSRKSLVSNDPGGSYLAYLIARGLVISLGRVGTVHGKGKGRSVQVYSLPLFLERGRVA